MGYQTIMTTVHPSTPHSPTGYTHMQIYTSTPGQTSVGANLQVKMKGKLNVMAPYSHGILFAPSLHGFRKRKIQKQEGMWIKGESRLGGVGVQRLNTSTQGLEGSQHTFVCFFQGKNNSSHECVPNESTTTSLNKQNHTHTQTQRQQQQQQLKLAYSTL